MLRIDVLAVLRAEMVGISFCSKRNSKSQGFVGDEYPGWLKVCRFLVRFFYLSTSCFDPMVFVDA